MLDTGDVVALGGVAVEVRVTPGRTDGCSSFVENRTRAVFTGDTRCIRGAGRTEFQWSDAHRSYRSAREQTFTFPGHFAVYLDTPIKDAVSSTIASERAHNPRLGDVVREQAVVG